MDVRFQPYRLENSRCFSGTDARISCIACHDPHKDLATSSAYYDQKCLACHGTTTAAAHVVVSPANSSQSEKPKTCPVAKSNCVSCHMPRVPLPVSGNHLTFTDHQIRIVRPGDAYPN
jgi:nitrate reductase cytochrome c-type subunit